MPGLPGAAAGSAPMLMPTWTVKVGRLAVGIEEARSAAVRVDMRGTPAAIYDGLVRAGYCGRHRLWLSVATNTVLIALALNDPSFGRFAPGARYRSRMICGPCTGPPARHPA